MEHGKDHEERRFHNENKTTRRKDDRAVDPEESLPPAEPGPGAYQPGGDVNG